MSTETTIQGPTAAAVGDPSQAPADPHAPTAMAVKVDRHGTLRRLDGKLVPGHGGVPGSGRPKGLAARVRELVDFDKAIEVLADILYGKLAPAARMADRLKAAEILFDRGWGKAHQTLDVKGEGAGPGESVRNLPLDKLFAMRAALQGLQSGATVAHPPEEPSAEAIDAASLEQDGEEPEGKQALTLALPDPGPPVNVIRRHSFAGSSNIVRATLDDAGILCVWFTSGMMYRYADFTPVKWDQWVAAPSAGSWFAKVIKPNHRQVK